MVHPMSLTLCNVDIPPLKGFMMNNQAFKFLLDIRKTVLAAQTGKTLDILLHLRAPVSGDRPIAKTLLVLALVIDRSGSIGRGKLTGD